MATDLTVALFNRPGTLASATAVLGSAGINIDGQCAYICEGRGVYHLLVEQVPRAHRALIDAGFEILEERRVVLATIEDRPGATAELLSHIADRGVSVELTYLATDGRLVLGGPDPAAIAEAIQ